MQRIKIGLAGILAVICLIAAMPAASASEPQTAQAPAPTEPADGKIYFCIEGLERILPGDYYACRAKYHFQREHYWRAISMLEESAYWANKTAQYTLGVIYFNGDTHGIPANRPLGIAWLALAAERKDPLYARAYVVARAHSTPEEIQAATGLWLKMRQKYGDSIAGLRALRRFNHEIVPLEEAANSGGLSYLSGYSPLPENAPSVVNDLHARADRDFDGLVGTVTVGALQEK